MTSLDISANNLDRRCVLPEGWTEDGPPWRRTYKHADGREQKEHPGKPEGVIALADAIKKSWALEKLLMAKNNLCNKKAGKALATMLAGNTTLKELDVSDNQGLGAYDGPGFAQELANGVKNNGAMTSLNISSNNLGRYFNGNKNQWISDITGVQALAAALPECK